MKIEYTEEKNKSIMETLLTTALDVEQMMAVGYALAKQVKKEPIKKDTTDHFCYVCPVCGKGVWGEFAKAMDCVSTYCNDCGQRLR